MSETYILEAIRAPLFLRANLGSCPAQGQSPRRRLWAHHQTENPARRAASRANGRISQGLGRGLSALGGCDRRLARWARAIPTGQGHIPGRTAMRLKSDPPPIVAQQPIAEALRCNCPECRALDLQYPREGFQLSLLRWLELGMDKRTSNAL